MIRHLNSGRRLEVHASAEEAKGGLDGGEGKPLQAAAVGVSSTGR